MSFIAVVYFLFVVAFPVQNLPNTKFFIAFYVLRLEGFQLESCQFCRNSWNPSDSCGISGAVKSTADNHFSSRQVCRT